MSDRARVATGVDAGAAAAMATASVGMIVALTAVGMMFAALLLAYGIVRTQAPAWPPPGEAPLPPLWGWRIAATLASLGGSAAMARAVRFARVGERRGEGRALAGAAAAGVVFLAAQAAALAALQRAGIAPGSGLAASVVYALCLFHGVHALAALALLAPVGGGARRWVVAPARLASLAALALLAPVGGGARRWVVPPARLASLAAFWHLVTAVWIAVFVGVFIL